MKLAWVVFIKDEDVRRGIHLAEVEPDTGHDDDTREATSFCGMNGVWGSETNDWEYADTFLFDFPLCPECAEKTVADLWDLVNG